MDELRYFAQNVGRLRRERGVSVAKLAGALNIGRKSVMKLDNGEVPPRMSVEVLFRASRFFNVSVSSLFQRPGL